MRRRSVIPFRIQKCRTNAYWTGQHNIAVNSKLIGISYCTDSPLQGTRKLYLKVMTVNASSLEATKVRPSEMKLKFTDPNFPFSAVNIGFYSITRANDVMTYTPVDLNIASNRRFGWVGLVIACQIINRDERF